MQRKIRVSNLDSLFSKYVRSKANYKCERCFKQYVPPTSGLHCSHFWGRAKKSVRWDEQNCASFCYGCHMHFTAQPEEHRAFFLKRLGKRRYDALMLRANMVSKKPDLKLLTIYFNKKTEALKLKEN